MSKFVFQYGKDPKPTVTKTGETKGNVALWFATDNRKSDNVEGDITTFEYDGSKGSMPTKIFEKNFQEVTD